MCAGWPIFTLPISPSGMKPRRYTLERSSSVTIAVPACTTSPGSAARVSTVPENGARTVKSARSATACASVACACAVAAFVEAIVDCCWAICASVLETCATRIFGLSRLACAVVSAPRDDSTRRCAAATAAACWSACTSACSPCSSEAAPVFAKREYASRLNSARRSAACCSTRSACAAVRSACACRTRPSASMVDWPVCN